MNTEFNPLQSRACIKNICKNSLTPSSSCVNGTDQQIVNLRKIHVFHQKYDILSQQYNVKSVSN